MIYFSVEATFNLYNLPYPQFCWVFSPQVLLQPSSTHSWLKPHPPINVLAIATALSWQLLTQARLKAFLPEMGAMQGERTVFSTRLCIGGQQWPIQSKPRCFQNGAQRRPWWLHPSGAPTHFPLSHPFCWSGTYCQRSLQEGKLQDESFTLDISGYVRVRVNIGSLCIQHCT